MPIDPARLHELVSGFVRHLSNHDAIMSHELLMRELAAAESVLVAESSDKSSALLVIGDGGAVSICRVDAGGASISHWGKLRGIEIEESFNIQRNGGPQAWTVRHPHLAGGTLSISAEAIELPARNEVSLILKSLLDP